MEKKCDTCRSYRPSVADAQNFKGETISFGECRRFPPNSVSAPISFWPRVQNTDWCGEHRTEGESGLLTQIDAIMHEMAKARVTTDPPKNPPADCPCGCCGDWFRHGVGDPDDSRPAPAPKEPVVDKEISAVTEQYLAEEEKPRITGPEEAMNRSKRGGGKKGKK